MRISSFHLVSTSTAATLGAFLRPPAGTRIAGLRHAECLAAMTLGAPMVSPDRMRLRTLAVFASWENVDALDAFLAKDWLGRRLSEGWHVRLELLRRWGSFPGFDDIPIRGEDTDPARPVVAVTIARLKLPQLFRFFRWGKPVEELVRDHPGATLAMAAIRPPRTFSTFSIWRSRQAMTDMVHGKGADPGASRHSEAIRERNRKDFHYSFTTLRFRAISEHGRWMGQGDFVPR
jgi:hypothetical protein